MPTTDLNASIPEIPMLHPCMIPSSSLTSTFSCMVCRAFCSTPQHSRRMASLVPWASDSNEKNFWSSTT